MSVLKSLVVLLLLASPLSFAAPADSPPTLAASPNPQGVLSAPDPRDSQLNRANEKLLIENAELKQQIGKLQVQVQVLKEAQSSQLLTRGAWMTLLAAALGFIAAVFLIKRKSEW